MTALCRDTNPVVILVALDIAYYPLIRQKLPLVGLRISRTLMFSYMTERPNHLARTLIVASFCSSNPATSLPVYAGRDRNRQSGSSAHSRVTAAIASSNDGTSLSPANAMPSTKRVYSGG